MGTTPRREKRAAARGFATRSEERQHRVRQRVTTAATAEGQLAAAFDWFRMAARRNAELPERGRVMRDMAQVLAEAAAALEGG